MSHWDVRWFLGSLLYFHGFHSKSSTKILAILKHARLELPDEHQLVGGLEHLLFFHMLGIS